jgi:hypothetical protein
MDPELDFLQNASLQTMMSSSEPRNDNTALVGDRLDSCLDLEVEPARRSSLRVPCI